MTRFRPVGTALATLSLSLVLVACGGSGGDGSSGDDDRFASVESFRETAGGMPGPATDQAVALANRFVLRYLAHAAGGEAGWAGVSGLPPLRVLTAVASGATGATAAELHSALGIGAEAGAAPERLRDLGTLARGDTGAAPVRARAWGPPGYRFLRSYLEALTADYGAELAPLEPTAAAPGGLAQVDAWAAEASEGRVSAVAPWSEEPERLRLAVAAVQGLEFAWTPELAGAEVFQGLFEEAGGAQFWVPMISAQATWPTLADPRFTAVDVPLNGGRYSLLWLRPAGGDIGGLLVELPDVLPEILAGLVPQAGAWALPILSVTAADGPLRGFLEGCGVSGALREDGAEFQGVNGLGYLYLEGLRAGSGFRLEAAGVSAFGSAAAFLAATPEEPPELWETPPGGVVITFPSVPCLGEEVYLPAGPADAGPGVLLLRDRVSGAVVHGVALRSLGGEPAGEWVCKGFPVEVWTPPTALPEVPLLPGARRPTARLTSPGAPR